MCVEVGAGCEFGEMCGGEGERMSGIGGRGGGGGGGLDCHCEGGVGMNGVLWRWMRLEVYSWRGSMVELVTAIDRKIKRSFQWLSLQQETIFCCQATRESMRRPEIRSFGNRLAKLPRIQ